ncbi:MAG: efflux RND transporter periplasmic adaptor subunit, partial [Lachnospiraceae bacterium]
MRKSIIGWGVVVIALGAVVVTKLMSNEPFTEGVANPIVEAAAPEYQDMLVHTSLVGKVEPESLVYVYPKQSGDVTETRVKTGDTVEAGQLLYVIDTRQVESAKSSMDSAQLALSQASDELSRQAILYSGGGISEQTYKQYQDSVKSAQITYENAKTNYEYQVSYTKITAPISGVIESSNVETHDVI